MKIVGHRGAEGYAPENTLLSFEKAIKLGCDRAELDVRLSKDGEIFVMHDAAVDRTTDGHGLVAEMTGDELKNLNCPSGQKIPTLQEVIDVCKGKIDLQIELKAGEGLAEKVNGLITKNKIDTQVVISSFELKYLFQIKNLNQGLKTMFLFDAFNDGVLAAIKEVPLDYIGPKAAIVTEQMISMAHAAGVSVYAFGVKDAAMGKRLEQIRVDDIGTPFPSLFL